MAMATTLQLPSLPRHGILLNPSPSTSPYSHAASLPGTPNLISSLSSLSSSASSTSPHILAEQDNYFLTYAAVRDPYSAIGRGGSSSTQAHAGSSLSRGNSVKKPSSAPQTRKIRFAPLPEPRRDESQLPDVFLDDSVENLNNFPVQRDALDTPKANPSSKPSSLLFSGHDHQAGSDNTPTTSNPNLQLGASSSKLAIAPIHTASSSMSSSDRDDSDWDITAPSSPATALSSSVERLPQSCPESPLNRRPELPREKKSLTKKLLKPLFGRSTITPEDVLTLGVNQLFRSSTRDSEDGSSGAATPAGAGTPARCRSKERAGSVSDGECGFGAPLSRSTSDNTAHKNKRKMSFLGFSQGNSSSGDGALWRTQSGPGDMRRVKSKEAAGADAKRPRSGSATQAYGPRRQLRMLNGRIYGAKRNSNNMANTNLFATARYVPPVLCGALCVI